VTSLSRPGSNSTGIFVSQLELAGKRIELLREAFPQARRVGLLWDAASQEQAEAATVVARKLGFDPRLLQLIGEPPNYPAALMGMDDSPSEPVMIPASPLALRDRATIARLLLERRTPSGLGSRRDSRPIHPAHRLGKHVPHLQHPSVFVRGKHL